MSGGTIPSSVIRGDVLGRGFAQKNDALASPRPCTPRKVPEEGVMFLRINVFNEV